MVKAAYYGILYQQIVGDGTFVIPFQNAYEDDHDKNSLAYN